MANDTSTGYLSNWSVDNVNGNRLISFSPLQYPFLSRVNGTRVASTPEFAMAGQYALESDAQTAITEADSVTAPTAIAYDTSNETNYVQIFQQSVNGDTLRIVGAAHGPRNSLQSQGLIVRAVKCSHKHMMNK